MAERKPPARLVVPGIDCEFLLCKHLRGPQYAVLKTADGRFVGRDVLSRIANALPPELAAGGDAYVRAAAAEQRKVTAELAGKGLVPPGGVGGSPPTRSDGAVVLSDALARPGQHDAAFSLSAADFARELDAAGRSMRQEWEQSIGEHKLMFSDGMSAPGPEAVFDDDAPWITAAALHRPTPGSGRPGPLDSSWEVNPFDPEDNQYLLQLQVTFGTMPNPSKTVFASAEVMAKMDAAIAADREKFVCKPMPAGDRPFWQAIARKGRLLDNLPRLIYCDNRDESGDLRGEYMRLCIGTGYDGLDYRYTCAGSPCPRWNSRYPASGHDGLDKLCPTCRMGLRRHQIVTHHGEHLLSPLGHALGFRRLGGMTWLKEPRATHFAGSVARPPDSNDARDFHRVNVLWSRGAPWCLEMPPSILPDVLERADWSVLPIECIRLTDPPDRGPLERIKANPSCPVEVVCVPRWPRWSRDTAIDVLEGVFRRVLVTPGPVAPALVRDHRELLRRSLFHAVDSPIRMSQLGMMPAGPAAFEGLGGPDVEIVECSCCRRELTSAMCLNAGWVNMGSHYFFRWGQCRHCRRVYLGDPWTYGDLADGSATDPVLKRMRIVLPANGLTGEAGQVLVGDL